MKAKPSLRFCSEWYIFMIIKLPTRLKVIVADKHETVLSFRGDKTNTKHTGGINRSQAPAPGKGLASLKVYNADEYEYQVRLSPYGSCIYRSRKSLGGLRARARGLKSTQTGLPWADRMKIITRFLRTEAINEPIKMTRKTPIASATPFEHTATNLFAHSHLF